VSPRGVAGNAPPSGNASGRLALRRQLASLADVEALAVYGEMCDAADARYRVESARVKAGALLVQRRAS